MVIMGIAFVLIENYNAVYWYTLCDGFTILIMFKPAVIVK